MLEQYYNKETYTLTLPTDYNSLLKDLPLDIKIIIIGDDYTKHTYSKFNQEVDNLPSSLTHGNIWMEI